MISPIRSMFSLNTTNNFKTFDVWSRCGAWSLRAGRKTTSINSVGQSPRNMKSMAAFSGLLFLNLFMPDQKTMPSPPNPLLHPWLRVHLDQHWTLRYCSHCTIRRKWSCHNNQTSLNRSQCLLLGFSSCSRHVFHVDPYTVWLKQFEAALNIVVVVIELYWCLD